jgi:hypothetical protein
MKYSGRFAVAVLIVIVMLALAGWAYQMSRTPQLEQARWPGVDESVVQKFAADAGRSAAEPLINTDQGDLLLFLFALCGTVAGFAAGYCWRMLISEKKTGS